MTRSVTISTPIPTLEEVGKRLGLSKRRQNSLLRLMRGESAPARVVVERRRDTAGTLKEKTTAFKVGK